MKPKDYIVTARKLANSGGSRRPRQSDLRRAVSTTYYALFHTLCQSVADLFIGGTGAQRSTPAWKQAYRSVSHGSVKTACKKQDVIGRFPQEIIDFADNFYSFQVKRHDADYDPSGHLTRYEVLQDIDTAESLITGFMRAPISDRRAFAAWICLPNRKSD